LPVEGVGGRLWAKSTRVHTTRLNHPRHIDQTPPSTSRVRRRGSQQFLSVGESDWSKAVGWRSHVRLAQIFHFGSSRAPSTRKRTETYASGPQTARNGREEGPDRSQGLRRLNWVLARSVPTVRSCAAARLPISVHTKCLASTILAVLVGCWHLKLVWPWPGS
jgi:hypothetical protein